MKLLKTLCLLGAIYCLTGPLLYWSCHMAIGAEAARLALPVTVLAAVFFCYTMVSLAVFNGLAKRRSKAMTGYYLIDKVARLFVSIIALTAYGFLVRDGILPFAVCLMVFYLVTAVYASWYCIRTENDIKKHTL